MLEDHNLQSHGFFKMSCPRFVGILWFHLPDLGNSKKDLKV